MAVTLSRRRFIGWAGLLCGAPAYGAGGALKTMFHATSPTTNAGSNRRMMIYVGGYTDGKKDGIHLFQMDLTSGKITPAGVGPDVANPSFLAIHPGRQFLYAVNEIGDFEGEKSGSVTAYAIHSGTGELTFLNVQPSGGSSPCHLVVHPDGKYVLVANYGGSVAVLPIEAGGGLGKARCVIQHHGSSVNPQRQEGPHAHSINLDPAGRFAYAPDLGADKIFTYRFDAGHGMLSLAHPAATTAVPGAGPRHFTFYPDGKKAYVINELNSTMTAFRCEPRTGALTPLQTLSTIPDGWKGTNTTAEVQVSPDGRFLYGSNRGHDSICIFEIDAHTGLLTPAGRQPSGGKTPRNFCIDPTGHTLLAANQDSGTVVIFHIDGESGALVPTGETLQTPMPTCVKMMALD